MNAIFGRKEELKEFLDELLDDKQIFEDRDKIKECFACSDGQEYSYVDCGELESPGKQLFHKMESLFLKHNLEWIYSEEKPDPCLTYRAMKDKEYRKYILCQYEIHESDIPVWLREKTSENKDEKAKINYIITVDSRKTKIKKYYKENDLLWSITDLIQDFKMDYLLVFLLQKKPLLDDIYDGYVKKIGSINDVKSITLETLRYERKLPEGYRQELLNSAKAGYYEQTTETLFIKEKEINTMKENYFLIPDFTEDEVQYTKVNRQTGNQTEAVDFKVKEMEKYHLTGGFISWYIENEKRIVIPDRIDGTDIIGIMHEAFRKKDVEEIVLPKGMKKIEFRAFLGCRKLKKVSFIDTPGKAEKIEKAVLKFCFLLNETYRIPDNVRILNSSCIYNPNYMETLILNRNIESIHDNSFKEVMIKRAVFEDGFTALNPRAFKDVRKVILATGEVIRIGFYKKASLDFDESKYKEIMAGFKVKNGNVIYEKEISHSMETDANAYTTGEDEDISISQILHLLKKDKDTFKGSKFFLLEPIIRRCIIKKDIEALSEILDAAFVGKLDFDELQNFAETRGASECKALLMKHRNDPNIEDVRTERTRTPLSPTSKNNIVSVEVKLDTGETLEVAQFPYWLENGNEVVIRDKNGQDKKGICVDVGLFKTMCTDPDCYIVEAYSIGKRIKETEEQKD